MRVSIAPERQKMVDGKEEGNRPSTSSNPSKGNVKLEGGNLSFCEMFQSVTEQQRNLRETINALSKTRHMEELTMAQTLNETLQNEKDVLEYQLVECTDENRKLREKLVEKEVVLEKTKSQLEHLTRLTFKMERNEKITEMQAEVYRLECERMDDERIAEKDLGKRSAEEPQKDKPWELDTKRLAEEIKKMKSIVQVEVAKEKQWSQSQSFDYDLKKFEEQASAREMEYEKNLNAEREKSKELEIEKASLERKNVELDASLQEQLSWKQKLYKEQVALEKKPSLLKQFLKEPPPTPSSIKRRYNTRFGATRQSTTSETVDLTLDAAAGSNANPEVPLTRPSDDIKESNPPVNCTSDRKKRAPRRRKHTLSDSDSSSDEFFNQELRKRIRASSFILQ